MSTLKLEIFPILPIEVDGRFMLDLERRIACVEVDLEHARGRFHFDDPRYESDLRGLFEGEAIEFVGHPPDGDAVRTYPAWTRDALNIVLRDRLKAISLGARPMPTQEFLQFARKT